MISSNLSNTNPKQLPSWFRFSLKEIESKYKSSAVLMGHYLIILLHDNSLDEDDAQKYYEAMNYQNPFRKPDVSEPAILLAVDLHDRSVQEAKIPPDSFFYYKNFKLMKYKDNQIISIGSAGKDDSVGCMLRITIESFQPFSVQCQNIENEDYDSPRPQLKFHTAQISQDCLYVYGVGINENFDDDEEEEEGSGGELWSFDLNNLKWKLYETTEQGPGRRKNLSSFVLKDSLYICGGDKLKERGYLGGGLLGRGLFGGGGGGGGGGGHFEEDDEQEEQEDDEEDDDNDDSSSLMKDIFVLNLGTMTWTRLEQKETYLMHKIGHYHRKKLDCALYNDHLLILGDGQTNKDSEIERLCCWNINTDSWSTFDVQRNKVHLKERDLTIYNNLLVCSGSTSDGDFALSLLNLEDVGLSVSETQEQKNFKSLFLSEEGAGIKLKVQDRIIPVHKQVLIERSEYFANLFDSGMTESKQDTIEISNCDYPIFQEFLRFLYCNEVQLDENLALNLLAFADKYAQSDLVHKCMDFLKYNTNTDNVYLILDFAIQENISHLKDWCLTFLKNKINSSNISGLVNYLNEQNKPKNLELRDKAIDVLTKDYIDISKDQKTSSYYEDFLIRNIEFDTVLTLVNFISGHNYKREASQWNEKPKGFSNKPQVDSNIDKDLAKKEEEKLVPLTVNLRTALNNFVWENLKTLRENKTAKELPSTFLTGLLGVVIEAQHKQSNELHA